MWHLAVPNYVNCSDAACHVPQYIAWIVRHVHCVPDAHSTHNYIGHVNAHIHACRTTLVI